MSRLETLLWKISQITAYRWHNSYIVFIVRKTQGPAYNECENARIVAGWEWVSLLTELLNTYVNDFVAKRVACCNQAIAFTELFKPDTSDPSGSSCDDARHWRHGDNESALG